MAEAGSAFPAPIIVKVTNARGSPVAGVAVTFDVSAGLGTPGQTAASTDAQGLCQTTVTAGLTGGTLTFTARAAGVTQAATTNLTIVQTPTAVSVVSGGGQIADPGTQFGAAVVAKVADARGNGVAGVAVTFEVASGSLLVSPATTTTTAGGLASTNVTAGATGGAASITVRVAGLAQTTVINLTVRVPSAQFAGNWTGTTSQGLAFFMRVGATGSVDSLSIRIRGSIPGGTCTATMTRTAIPIAGDRSFTAALSISTLWTTTVRGLFTAATDATGSFDTLQVSSVIICGSSVIFSSSGSTSAGGTWTARKP